MSTTRSMSLRSTRSSVRSARRWCSTSSCERWSEGGGLSGKAGNTWRLVDESLVLFSPLEAAEQNLRFELLQTRTRSWVPRLQLEYASPRSGFQFRLLQRLIHHGHVDVCACDVGMARCRKSKYPCGPRNVFPVVEVNRDFVEHDMAVRVLVH